MANGYKLFSTGEVLTATNVNDYLMKQTVMIFASAAARTTALSGVLREGMLSYRLDAHVLEVYNGTIWEAPETNLTTKGDLATFDTAPTRLAVGSDGQTLVANSANASGLGWQPLNAAGKNAVINGGMDIWQRGTSFTNPVSAATAYSADRWLTCRYGYATNITTSRVASGLTGFNYAMRLQRNVGDAAGSAMFASYNCETADSLRFAGQTVTVSVYFRAGASFSGVSSTAFVTLHSGTGTDQNIVTGFTGDSTLINATPTISTTIQRFSYSAAVPSNATQVGLQLGWNPTGTAGANDYLDIVGVQLELGSVATTFSRAGDVLQGELEACQRYYFRATSPLNAYGTLAMGSAISTSIIRVSVKTPVTMRVTPTTIDFSTLFASDGVGGSALTTCVGATSTPDYPSVDCGGGSGLTQYRPYALTTNNSTSGYLGFSAEL